ncbi:MAG: HAD family phosphatase [Deltaproteobacteria bacterium]|nr:HAD family phosphatase [Deltaproteobacteria bacterium]
MRALKKAGVPIAVGSSGPRLNVELALRVVGVTGEFEVVVTGDDVTHGKPDPEIFLTAAARLKMDPAACVVIEDAPQGVAAALAARMKVIGVMTTCEREPLSAAHLVVASLHDVSPSLIAGL